jgi:hypothetical protein
VDIKVRLVRQVQVRAGEQRDALCHRLPHGAPAKAVSHTALSIAVKNGEMQNEVCRGAHSRDHVDFAAWSATASACSALFSAVATNCAVVVNAAPASVGGNAARRRAWRLPLRRPREASGRR